MLFEFQCVVSRIAWIVCLVVPSSLEIWLSASSGWLRTSQAIAAGRSCRLDNGVYRGAFFFCSGAETPFFMLSRRDGSS